MADWNRQVKLSGCAARMHRAGAQVLITNNMDRKNDQFYNGDMKKINAAKFKEQCLAILDNVDAEGIIITKHGKPVAKLTPVTSEHAQLIGSLKGKLKIRGNIFSTGLKWDAES